MNAIQIVVLGAAAWVIVAIAVGLIFGAVIRRGDHRAAQEARPDQDRAELQTRHGADWWDWDR